MEPFKNLLSPEVVRQWGQALARSSGIPAEFRSESFIRETVKPLKDLELKQRVEWVCDQLRRSLPTDYKTAIGLIDPVVTQSKIEGFGLWPALMFVQKYGLEHVEFSLETLARWTEGFSAEFAVRPYLAAHPRATFAFLEKMTQSSNEHHRRWASEGCRPRLPWGERLGALCEDPAPVLKILARLADDPSEYVRRSVANNVNDIAKDHPEIALEIVRGWKKKSITHYRKMSHHALRTLVKGGDRRALELTGVTVSADAKASLALRKNRVVVGDALLFDVGLVNRGARRAAIVVDYRIHFLLANGRHGIKVYKGRRIELEPAAKMQWTLKHSFRVITTRRYYPGEHRIDLLVNGAPTKACTFEVRPT